MRVVDISGQRFGRLTVIERFGHNGKRITWLCKCDCGNEKIVIGEDLKNGSTKSCGCLFKEGNNRKHGLCSSRLYNSYRAMKDRCLHASHPGYKNYEE